MASSLIRVTVLHLVCIVVILFLIVGGLIRVNYLPQPPVPAPTAISALHTTQTTITNVSTNISSSSNETSSPTAIATASGATESRKNISGETIATPSPEDQERLPLWKTPNNFTWLYSAYYDDREKLFGPAVIVYGFQDFRKEILYYCSIGYSNVSQPLCLDKPAERRMVHRNKWSYKVYGYQYICRLPSLADVPKWVALVPFEHCRPPDGLSTKIYWISVQFDRPEKKMKFGICVESPAYNWNDTQLFPEFIEMHRILGVEWFTIYIQSMGQQAREVLQGYVAEGLVELVEWNTSLSKPWRVHYYGQLLLTNDCLMRNMYKVEYLAFIDRDEVIVPYSREDWHGMLKQIDQPSRGVFIFDHVFFHKKDNGFVKGFNRSMLGCPQMNPPRYFTFRYRSKSINHYRLKTIVKPDKVSRMTTHEVMDFIPGYSGYYVPRNIAINHHYRQPDYAPKDSVMLDTKMVKFISPLLSALNKRMCS